MSSFVETKRPAKGIATLFLTQLIACSTSVETKRPAKGIATVSSNTLATLCQFRGNQETRQGDCDRNFYYSLLRIFYRGNQETRQGDCDNEDFKPITSHSHSWKPRDPPRGLRLNFPSIFLSIFFAVETKRPAKGIATIVTKLLYPISSLCGNQKTRQGDCDRGSTFSFKSHGKVWWKPKDPPRGLRLI